MKSFVFCIILFALITAGVIWNMHYIHSIIDELIEYAENLPQSIEELETNPEKYTETVENLYNLWDKKVNRISYTVGYGRIDYTDDALLEVYCSYYTKSYGDFILARKNLLDSLYRMRLLESISIENIF